MLKRAYIFVLPLALAAVTRPVEAAESGSNIYPLGSLTFGAGDTPPPGFYVTPLIGFYSGRIGGTVNVGRDLVVDLRAKFYNSGVNLLYAPPVEFLGGHPAFSMTVPVGYIDFTANAAVGSLATSRAVDGGGLGDVSLRTQLGWKSGSFAHTFYVTGWLPTGRYEPTFAANIGLNRPAIDATWGFSYLEKNTEIEISAAIGLTFNATNTATDYKTGIEGHIEWGVAKKVTEALSLGVVGYQYKQLTGDSGSGATLGAFKGRNNGVGPGLSYATKLGEHIAVLNLRHYWEYGAERHFSGNLTTASLTIRY